MKYVYELYNDKDIVEYVGESNNPHKRFINHKSNSKGNGSGKFYNRPDIKMRIVAKFENKKEAYQYQIKLQEKYGLKTDTERRAINCRNGGLARIKNLIEQNRKTGHINKLMNLLHSKEIREKAGKTKSKNHKVKVNAD